MAAPESKTTLRTRRPAEGETPIVSPQASIGSGNSEDLSANQKDAGNKPNNHYKSKLSPLRYRLRSWCLPIVRQETEILAQIQLKVRHPVLDAYFAWTACLASHTFYVLMLPLPLWYGASSFARDLIFVLGVGIYVTGFSKDFLCLPRPRSPPLHRITMLSYTTQEYGWPSSHSANATAVTLVVLAKLHSLRDQMEPTTLYALYALLALYYISLIVGRLYCGMHGFFDVLAGGAIGLTLFLVRYWWGSELDHLMFHSARNNSWWGIAATFAFIVFGHLWLIHIYPEPVDDCPCFDDSVAFVGVLIGIDCSHYFCVLTQFFGPNTTMYDAVAVPFNQDRSYLIWAARFVVGVSLVVAWKAILKPVIFTILPPIYKFVGVYLPRSHFISTAHSKTTTRQIRLQSLSNMKTDPMIQLNDVLRGVKSDKDAMGPEDDIDAYELLDYQSKNPGLGVNVKISGVFRPRYDVEIIGRTIVYAGISAMSVWGFGLVARLLGL